ncbi:MAG: DNA replication and repair protein RecF [Candidatus Marinimicrobia bacterium]|nr:DNA replication and repair protein RecF [Candidatus Neomarinimicrobiota bacterium]
MIKQLTVKNFRIFEEKTVDFQPGVNVILGKNGVGKTSLLEAIYFTSFTKSFKAPQDVDMIKQDADFFQTASLWEGNKYSKAQANYLKKKGKRFIFDDETMIRMADVIGSFPLVFQSPEDFRVTAGPSIERRGYFDRFISQISQPYLQDLITYRKLLKNRNAHLKQLSEKKEYRYTAQLEAYDEQLSPIMFRIVNTRRSYSEKFNKHLEELYKSTFDNGSTGTIVYKPSLTAKTEADFQIIHREQTQNNIDKEIILRRTLWGPNYDKYLFLRNDTPLIHYASQGEHKIWMTLLKLAEGEIITKLQKAEPIYLLDDLFAELDLNNSKRIVQKIMDAKQVLITTTDMSDLRRHGMDISKNNINVIEIA